MLPNCLIELMKYAYLVRIKTMREWYDSFYNYFSLWYTTYPYPEMMLGILNTKNTKSNNIYKPVSSENKNRLYQM